MSRFAIDSGMSRLTAKARSSLHPISYQAPLSGHLDAGVTDGAFVTTEPITATLEVVLDELRSTDAHLDAELQRRLDIRRFPRASAVVHRVDALGHDTYRLHAALTLHGTSRSLEGTATVTLHGGRLHATGSVRVDIRHFGIKPPSLLMLRVNPEVEITIDLVATVADG